MKTTQKLLLLFLTLSLNNVIFAQNENKSSNLFVRVYNLEGTRINNGKIISVSDTLLKLKHQKKIAEINAKDIGWIRTKRSVGNNVLFGSLIGATAGAIVGVISYDKPRVSNDSGLWLDGVYELSAPESALIGVIIGGGAGAGIGALTSLFKKSKTFIINGDTSKWKLFIESISN
jgi:hypothetical protein